MNQRQFCQSGLILLTSLSRLANADPSAPPKAPKVAVGKVGQSISDFVEKAHQKVGFSGAVLAAKNGKVLAATAVGMLDEKKSQPLETTSLFEIASCTKIFTALAILRLQEAGKLKFDDPIGKYLPGVPDNCHSITIRHLLQHTSGIPGTNTNGSGNDLSKVLPTFLEGGPKHPPGTHWEYWNQGYALLSEIISRASGKTYIKYCQDEIFLPCKMSHSRFTGQQPPANTTVAIGHSSTGASRSALQHPYGSYGFQYRGMGGLVTSLADLWHWDRAMAGGKFLNAASLKEMATPGPGNYGLGCFIDTKPDGKQVLRHGGSVRGFLAEIRRYPTDDACLFVLSNSDSSLPISLVTEGCESILFDKPAGIDFPTPLSETLLPQIEGEYKDDRGRRFVIAREDRLVRATIFWGGPETNGYLGEDDKGKMRLFMLSGDPIAFQPTNLLHLDFDDRGKATSISILDLKPKLKFDRVKTQ